MDAKPVQLIIPSDSRYLSLTRKVIEHFLSYKEVPSDLIYKVVLCVDEACSNIIKYSYDGKDNCPIEITFRLENDEFTVEVRDYGKQCDTASFRPRELDNIRPGGLGTLFINSIMDNVHYCTDRDCGTLLTMSKKLNFAESKPTPQEN
ncbi:MAG: ATP-binding protein [Nitrospina sp.]|nr:ATP-binding protein [Nitrospina sp.]